MAGKPSKVWFLCWDKRDLLPLLLETAGLQEVLEPKDFVAIKAHFGEKGNTGYVKPAYFAPIVKVARERKTHPFLTDTNTIYHGERNNALGHLAVASEHGFSLEKTGVPVIIADGVIGNSYGEVKIGGKHFKKVKIARSILDADAIIAVSHFKGHLLAGFGGTIKNLGMGCAARLGKFEMHSGASPTVSKKDCIACGACIDICAHGALDIDGGTVNIDLKKCAGCGECIIVCAPGALKITWSEPGGNVQEKFVEYAMGAVKGKRLFCVTFLNRITPNCDCIGKNERSMVPDIGILASKDPVAIDQAAVDLALKHAGGDILKKAHPNIDYTVQLEYAQNAGFGSRRYELLRVE